MARALNATVLATGGFLVSGLPPRRALATVVDMTNRIQAVPKETRAAVAAAGGAARSEALTPERRSEIARAGAAKTNSPEGRALSIRRAWPGMRAPERRAVAAALAGCKGLDALIAKAPAES